MAPTTKAGIAIRAPTIIPAPTVPTERLSASTAAIFDDANPARNPIPMPLPSFAIERLSRSLSVKARRMLATAKPEG